MRVAIPHALPKDEVRRRLASRTGEIGEFVPGLASVDASWPSEHRMSLDVKAMGQTVASTIDIEDHQVVIQVALPMMLSFIEPMIQKAITERGQKLLK